MKPLGIAASVVAIAAALAVAWGLGLGRAEDSSADAGPSAVASTSGGKSVVPLRTAAWMLASSQAAPPARQRLDQNEDDSACGAGRLACPQDAICVDGGCLTTVCTTDGGSGAGCALPSGAVGVCCGESCLNLDGDAANCGQCGVSCQSGLQCVSGRCEARTCAGRMAGTACTAAGHEEGACCRGDCVDRAAWTTDSSNCGGCGHSCAPGLTCARGACIDPSTGGLPSWTCLDDGHACPSGSFCVLDACYPRACTGDNDGSLCPGLTGGQLGHCCGQICTDVFADRDNCRACGVRCPPAQSCKNGECSDP